MEISYSQQNNPLSEYKCFIISWTHCGNGDLRRQKNQKHFKKQVDILCNNKKIIQTILKTLPTVQIKINELKIN